MKLLRYSFLGAIILFMTGFILFLSLLPHKLPNMNDYKNNNIAVVFTGGAGRLRAGLDLLKQRKIDQLFISGVYHGNNVRDILEIYQNDQMLASKIILGYFATNTSGNALETSTWIIQNQLFNHNIYIITNDYHMPRSLLALEREIARVSLSPHQVNVIAYGLKKHQLSFNNTQQSLKYLKLLISEYIKYLITLIL